jgi:hypothetical protein
MKVTTVGLDLAKQVFPVRGVATARLLHADRVGTALLRRGNFRRL